MKKSVAVTIGIVVLIILVGGGYAIFHKSSKPVASSTSTTKNSVPVVNNSVVITKSSATLGQYLADPSGNTLYTYSQDTSGVSNCTGSCLANWPAYQATSSSTTLPSGISTIKRTDNGQTQYTYNGLPLYFFAGDSKGQATGNGVSNFSLARPAKTTSLSSSSSNAPATTSTPAGSSSTSSSGTAPSGSGSSYNAY